MSQLILPLIIFLQFLLFFIYRHNLPIFDGGTYYYHLQNVVNTTPWSLFKYGPFAHTSYLYFFILGMVQKFSHDSIEVINFFSTSLLSLATWSFRQSINLLLPSSLYQSEKNFALATFGLFPLFLSNIFHFNTDYPLMIFSTFLLHSLLEGSHKMSFFWGIMLIFTKETGVLTYCSLLGAYTLILAKPNFKTFRQFFYKRFYLLFPPIIFISFTIFLKPHVQEIGTWSPVEKQLLTPNNLWKLLSSFELFHSPLLQSALVIIFFLNFHWILWSPAIAAIFSQTLHTPTPTRRPYAFALLASFFTLYSVTRFLSYSNPRYFIVVFPPLIMAALLGSLHVFPQQKWRKIYWGIAFIFILASNFASFEPIAEKILGHCNFGNRRVVALAKNDPCCSCARDQIVYNLQYLNIGNILDQFFAALPKQSQLPPIYTQEESCFWMYWMRDKVTFERTHHYNERGNHLPIQCIKNTDEINLDPTLAFYFLDTKLYENTHFIHKALEKNFIIQERKFFSSQGHQMELYYFVPGISQAGLFSKDLLRKNRGSN